MKINATTLFSIGRRSCTRVAFSPGSRNQPFSGRHIAARPASITPIVKSASFRPRFSTSLSGPISSVISLASSSPRDGS